MGLKTVVFLLIINLFLVCSVNFFKVKTEKKELFLTIGRGTGLVEAGCMRNRHIRLR